jgi:cellulose synthase/poly-beta-1,6-N-acetylglucosamine synthase-like glycosyltransferase
MSIPKVLVCSPTYDGKRYIEKEYYENIKTLNYPNYDIYIVDNSSDKTYYSHLKRKFGTGFGKDIQTLEQRKWFKRRSHSFI